MKYLEKLCRPRQLKTEKRKPKTLRLVALALALSLGWINPAVPQDLLDSQGLRFRLIPGGSYFMGSPLNEPGRYASEPTPYKVALKAFYLAETETTNAQYARFLKATGHPPPLYWEDKNLNAPQQPVVGVTWHDANAFCAWLSRQTDVPHRLPTEAEWEAAARGGLTSEPYPWGREAPDAGQRYRANYYPNTFADDGFQYTAPVGSYPPNGYGLSDMAGNAAEWCADQSASPPHQAPFTSASHRIVKGGSWYSRARDLRCASRQLIPPYTADGYLGFRVWRQALPEP